MTFFQRFYVLIAAVLTIGFWLLANTVFHVEQGWPRGLVVLGTVLLFGLICWLGNRSQGTPRA